MRSAILGTVTFLNGFAFAGYRSFPSDNLAVLYPLGKINLIVGQNNSGKSNVLRALSGTLTQATVHGFPQDKGKLLMSEYDRPLHDRGSKVRRRIWISPKQIIAMLPQLLEGDDSSEQLLTQFNNLARSMPYDSVQNRNEDELLGFWIDITEEGENNQGANSSLVNQIGSWPELANLLKLVGDKDTRSRLEEAPGERLLDLMIRAQQRLPYAYLMNAVRSIADANQETPDLNGKGIKEQLQKLQSPTTAELGNLERFAALQEFVRSVLSDPSALINVAHNRETIHITQNNRTLPIENMGTGIHEVVIIAAAATVTQNSVLCIEEPEVHLHPVLQRKLLKHLVEHTSNQYFISTHSAHMLDSELGTIFHVSIENGKSAIRYAGSAKERAAICADLGYRPSDLVQTNAILWVEGPSDRIYLKHWIDKQAPGRFVEGTHYSVMFYGGSLLNALSPLDAEEVDEFISLRNLNRYMAILIDSDKKSAADTLNDTKQRVIADISSDPNTGVAWVTAGYTIENYVPESVMTAAIHTAHPGTAGTDFATVDQWSNPISEDRLGIKQARKVAIAKRAVQQWPDDEWPLDLKERVGEIIALIENANSHN